MLTVAYFESIVREQTAHLRLSHHEREAVILSLYAFHCLLAGEVERAAEYFAKAEIERRAQ